MVTIILFRRCELADLYGCISPYLTDKFNVVHLASYYGKDNIRINCVSPGGKFNNQNPTFVKNYEKKVPLKRIGTHEDISPAVSFLLSGEAKYITGQNFIYS